MRRSLTDLTAALIIAALGAGCTTASAPFAEEHSAAGVSSVRAELESGSVTYTGGAADRFLVNGQSWGQGRNPELAEERLAGNDWSVSVAGSSLMLGGSTDAGLAGVDFDVTGPGNINLSLLTSNGAVSIDNVSGFTQVTADRIDATRLRGEADLYANMGDINAQIEPMPGGSVRLEAASGDVYLDLPWGGDYDLQVWGDIDHQMVIDDLGFHWTTTAPGYFAGVAGAGTTKVDIYVTGGEVFVNQTW